MYLSCKTRTDNSKYSLECLMDSERNQPFKEWVWFTFEEIEAGIKDRPDIKLVWDNPDYLIKKFYPYLKDYLNRSLTKEQKEEFKDISKYLNEEDVENIVFMFEKTKELNWFKI
jgi:hypothetical protein